MKGLLVLVLLGVLVGSAAAAERPPAALMPAEVGLYVEVNLGCLAGDAPDHQVLQEALGLSKLMQLAEQSLGKDPAGQELTQLFSLVSRGGASLHWRVGAGLGVDIASLAGGGKPTLYVVASVSDSASCAEAVKALLASVKRPLTGVRAVGDVTYLFDEQDESVAVVAQGKDWVAFAAPASAIDDVVALATGESTASLAADSVYQRTVSVFPKDALLLEYTNPALVNGVFTMAAMARPTLNPPETPKNGAAWAVSLQVEEIQGRRLLKAVWQTDLDAAAALVQGPISAGVAPVLIRARESARKTQCLANVKNLAMAMNMYVTDWDAFPKADRWVAALDEYVRNETVFRCPSDTSGAKCSYGMNWGLSGKRASVVKDPARQVVIYETARPGDCPRGGKTDVAGDRHMGGSNYGYADGHAKWIADGDGAALDW